ALDDYCIEVIPRTNLSESRHASWLAGEGHKPKISLYDATVSDIGNTLLQQSKRMAYTEGKYIGIGPSIRKMRDKAASQQFHTPTPSQSSRAVNDAIRGTDLPKVPEFFGDRVTTTRRRKTFGNVIGKEANSSHRPEYVTQNVIQDQYMDEENEGVIIRAIEVDINDTMWAIRRCKPGSQFTCQGKIKGGKCKKKVNLCKEGTVAPSFWGKRNWEGRNNETWVWFCSDDVKHVWDVCPYIVMRPPRPPLEWPVAQGTDLTTHEVKSLQLAGFHIATETMEVQGQRRVGSICCAITFNLSCANDDILF
ncbi:hypothetical protein GOP47_0030519, partial [Adiantum capillus-veneris]